MYFPVGNKLPAGNEFVISLTYFCDSLRQAGDAEEFITTKIPPESTDAVIHELETIEG
jgi:hypothetical protein